MNDPIGVFYIVHPDGTLTDAGVVSEGITIQPEPDTSEPIITEFNASFEIEIPHSHKRADREARKALQRIFNPNVRDSATQPKQGPTRCHNCNRVIRSVCRKCQTQYNIKTR